MFKSGIFFKDFRRQLLATISGMCEGIVKFRKTIKFWQIVKFKERAIKFSWFVLCTNGSPPAILADALMPLQIEDKIHLTSRRLS